MSRLPPVALVVGIVMMLMGFGFAFALYGQPRDMLPALDHHQAAVRNLVTMPGTCSLTMAFALLVALLWRHLRREPAHGSSGTSFNLN